MQGSDLGKINILLVDDSLANLVALEAILDSPEYNLVQTTSAREAFALSDQMEFALALVDVQMPVLNGFELAQMIRSKNKRKLIPIIFLTAAQPSDELVLEGYKIGAVDFLFKPLHVDALRAKVSFFVEMHKSNKAQDRLLELEKEKAAHEKFKDMVESMNHTVIWSFDPEDESFTYVSPRAIDVTGYAVSQWKDKKNFFVNYLHPDDKEKVVALMRAAKEGEDYGIEHRFLHNEGRYIWFHTGIRKARHGKGANFELRGISVDVTNIKQSEEALKKSQTKLQAAIKYRDDFLSIASHELNTPLTSLKLQSYLLKRKIEEDGIDGVYKKISDVTSRQIERLIHLVEDMLDISRITTGRLQLNISETDMAQLLIQAIGSFEAEFQKLKIDHTLEVVDEISLKCDSLRIEQVISNIITNAIKYGNRKPISITLTQEDEFALIQVSDEGIGIAQEDIPKIFSKFERISENKRDRNITGLGLGLYVSKQILELHKGRIEVVSALNKGTTFKVFLPLNAIPREN